jgi:hypothetical protein
VARCCGSSEVLPHFKLDAGEAQAATRGQLTSYFHFSEDCAKVRFYEKLEAVSLNWAWDLAFEIENIYNSESHIEYFLNLEHL